MRFSCFFVWILSTILLMHSCWDRGLIVSSPAIRMIKGIGLTKVPDNRLTVLCPDVQRAPPCFRSVPCRYSDAADTLEGQELDLTQLPAAVTSFLERTLADVDWSQVDVDGPIFSTCIRVLPFEATRGDKMKRTQNFQFSNCFLRCLLFVLN